MKCTKLLEAITEFYTIYFMFIKLILGQLNIFGSPIIYQSDVYKNIYDKVIYEFYM